MTRKDIATLVAEQNGFNQEEVTTILNKSLDFMLTALGNGNKIELRGFGVFEVVTRKARVGRNPNNPSVDIHIPAKSVVKFYPGTEMREAVEKISPEPQSTAD